MAMPEDKLLGGKMSRGYSTVTEVARSAWPIFFFFFFFFFVYKNSALRQGYINSTAKTSMYPLSYKKLQ